MSEESTERSRSVPLEDDGLVMPWARLDLLPEARTAWNTLHALPNVEVDFWPGWSSVGLTLVTYVSTRHVGARIRMKQKFGSLRYQIVGGTMMTDRHALGPETFDCIDHMAAAVCETCGRPGESRAGPIGVYCDACFWLRTSGTGELPWAPRLPLIESVAEAQREVGEHPLLADIPAGWMRLARSTLEDLSATSPRVLIRFWIHGDCLSIVSLDDGDSDEIGFALERLEGSSRVRCRHCGRAVDHDSSTPGVCPGCHYLQTRPWRVVPAWEPDIGAAVPADGPGET